MIKLDELKDLIKTVLYSGYVANEKPLSMMFVGAVGIGKSELLNKFQLIDNIIYLTDVTYMGMIQLLEEHKQVRHIIIPDFLKITMRKKSTVDNMTSCFNALMEDGLFKISMMGKPYDFKGKHIGLITSTTKDSFVMHREKWKRMGFLSRMITVSYNYSTTTTELIFDYIFKREYLKGDKRPDLQMPIKNIDVELPYKLAKGLREKHTIFRSQKQLQTLAMARTLLDDRKERIVTDEDIKKINSFKKFMNLDFTQI